VAKTLVNKLAQELGFSSTSESEELKEKEEVEEEENPVHKYIW
jgi:phage terminase small subunit